MEGHQPPKIVQHVQRSTWSRIPMRSLVRRSPTFTRGAVFDSGPLAISSPVGQQNRFMALSSWRPIGPSCLKVQAQGATTGPRSLVREKACELETSDAHKIGGRAGTGDQFFLSSDSILCGRFTK